MDPIVISCPLQWLSRIDGFVHLFLLLAIKVRHLLSSFTLNAITLALLLSLLLMRRFWWLDKVMFGLFNWTEHTFVLLGEV